MAIPKVYVKYNHDWEEYTVHITGRPKATYHTPDKDDAIATKKAMIKELEREQEGK